MDTKRFRIQAGLAAAAAAALISGAAWHGLAAGPASAHATATATAETPTRAPIAGERDSYADVVKAVAPAVVTIRVDGKATAAPTQFDDGSGDDFFRRFFGDDDQPGQRRQRAVPRSYRQHGLGSGVVVSSDGYILTNNHVVDGADQIHIDLTDGRTLEAKVIGTDKASDLALVKVSATGLPVAALGNSDGAQIGDVVLAIGNPLGVGQTVTMGIVSAKGRSTGSGDGGYQDFLETDAPINHGNSGGALVNTKGEVIGINAEMLSPVDANIGIGFAIPSNMAKHVMADLKNDGHVRRAQLGVEVQAVTSDLADSLGLKHVAGAIVGKVTPDSAADRAGLKRGDVILSFNGQPVSDVNSLRNHVAESQPGSTASVVINRDGAEKTVSVKLDEAGKGEFASRRDRGSDSSDKAALGISVEKNKDGLVITDVDPDGRAADAGLQAGDVIQEVNRKPVSSVDDLRAAVRARTDRPVLLLVARDGHTRFVTVRPANG
jgi:Do/DeqQ family serine protease